MDIRCPKALNSPKNTIKVASSVLPLEYDILLKNRFHVPYITVDNLAMEITEFGGCTICFELVVNLE